MAEVAFEDVSEGCPGGVTTVRDASLAKPGLITLGIFTFLTFLGN